MSKLRDLLGRCAKLEFGNREWLVHPLTFNDLCDLEEHFGDVSSIDLAKASTQRYLLWLVLRDPKSDHERFESEFVVGDILGLDDPKQTADFVTEVFKLCGLVGNDVGTTVTDDSQRAIGSEVGEKKRARTRRVQAAVSAASTSGQPD